MKILKKLSILAIALIAAAAITCTDVRAESSNIDGSCYYDGSRIISEFDSGKVANAITDLQPGDDVTFTVKYTNEFNGSTDWYMSNKVLLTLEKANAAKKVQGTGTPENGGYTYQLIHKDNDGNSRVLFSNAKVGGEARPAGMQGLEQATNALDEWFFIQTLEKKGQHGTVILKVALEGETEVNDYMDTNGEVMIKFAVENTPKGVNKKYSGNGVSTGDTANLWPWIIAMMIAGLLLLLLALRSRRKDDEAKVKAGRITMLVFAMLFAAGAAGAFGAPGAPADTAYAADDDGYTYTVTVYSGKEGYFDGDENKHEKTVNAKAEYGQPYTIDMDDLDLTLVDGDKYYPRGLKRAGHDNDEVSQMQYQSYTFTVTKDEAFTVAYGMKGGMVQYTVRYVDKSGNNLIPPKEYYGMAGDKPVVSCKYVEGYIPDTLNIGKTLVADKSKNVFKFTYSKNAGVPGTYTEEDADGDGTGADRNGNAGTNGNGTNAAGAGTGAPGTYTAGDGDNGPSNFTDLDAGDTPMAPGSDQDKDESGGFFSGINTLMMAIIAAGIIIALLLLYFILRRRGEEE